MHFMGVPAALIAAISTAPAWAQTENVADPHAGHGQMTADPALGKASQDEAHHAGMDHGALAAPAPVMPAEPGGTAVVEGGDVMDHGDMKMQGGSAPPEARDPHAYAGADDSAMGPRQLHLSDQRRFGSVYVDRLERVRVDDDEYATIYDAQAWFGRQYDRLVLKAEGEYARGEVREARTELLWGHAVASYWDTQLGVRYDSGEGPDRTWLALGLQGLAPYWFELDATAYVGESGRTALRLEAEYELLITQRLVLQPRAEVNFYGKDDEERSVGSGLSDAVAGLRLRYEITRQLAPYVGVEWADVFGQTRDLAEEAGGSSSETRWVAGLRFWF